MIEELPDILYVYSILACTLPILGSDGYLTVVTYVWPYTYIAYWIVPSIKALKLLSKPICWVTCYINKAHLQWGRSQIKTQVLVARPDICHLSPVTCHLSPVICHLSPVTCYLSSVICHVSSVTCHLSPVICHLSSVTCHLSPVICHLSPVICHRAVAVAVRLVFV